MTMAVVATTTTIVVATTTTITLPPTPKALSRVPRLPLCGRNLMVAQLRRAMRSLQFNSIHDSITTRDALTSIQFNSRRAMRSQFNSISISAMRFTIRYDNSINFNRAMRNTTIQFQSARCALQQLKFHFNWSSAMRSNPSAMRSEPNINIHSSVACCLYSIWPDQP